MRKLLLILSGMLCASQIFASSINSNSFDRLPDTWSRQFKGYLDYKSAHLLGATSKSMHQFTSDLRDDISPDLSQLSDTEVIKLGFKNPDVIQNSTKTMLENKLPIFKKDEEKLFAIKIWSKIWLTIQNKTRSILFDQLKLQMSDSAWNKVKSLMDGESNYWFSLYCSELVDIINDDFSTLAPNVHLNDVNTAEINASLEVRSRIVTPNDKLLRALISSHLNEILASNNDLGVCDQVLYNIIVQDLNRLYNKLLSVCQYLSFKFFLKTSEDTERTYIEDQLNSFQNQIDEEAIDLSEIYEHVGLGYFDFQDKVIRNFILPIQQYSKRDAVGLVF